MMEQPHEMTTKNSGDQARQSNRLTSQNRLEKVQFQTLNLVAPKIGSLENTHEQWSKKGELALDPVKVKKIGQANEWAKPSMTTPFQCLLIQDRPKATPHHSNQLIALPNLSQAHTGCISARGKPRLIEPTVNGRE